MKPADQAFDLAAETARLRARWRYVLAGTALLVNSYLAPLVYRDNPLAGDLAALLAALLLAVPLLVESLLSRESGPRGVHDLVALAVLAALASGELQAAAAVAVFLHLGRLIETRTAVGARQAVEAVMRLAPETACRVSETGEEETIDSAALRVGDLVRVRPGENIPADGEVTAGVSTVDQSSVTGESLPVELAPGSPAFAGTTNLTGVLTLRVGRVGDDTTLGRVRNLILEAEASRLPIQRMTDAYAGVYTPTILMIAGLVWFFTQELSRVVAVLVIGVPGSFILAGPTAVVAALAAAARHGVQVKNTAQLETAARVDAVLLDKTGTITLGQLTVSHLQPCGEVTAAELLRLAAAAELGSRHPAAVAIVAVASEHRLALPPAEDFAETAGRGIEATVEGRRLRLGTGAWMLEAGVDPERFAVPPEAAAAGSSLVYSLVDGRPAGWFALADAVRPEAGEAVARLRTDGARRVMMVTGDRQAVAEAVGRPLGLDEIRAECLPWEKVAAVEEAAAAGHVVAMVGDGVNDGAALAAADLGIAMGAGGSDTALNSASIAILSDDLRLVPFTLRLARSCRAVVNQNLAIGLIFIIIGLVASGLGWLGPVAAAIFHNIDEVLVVFNSARLVRAGEELLPAQEEGS